MKAALIQTQLGLNAQVLSGLYDEHRTLKMSRKMYNEMSDDYFVQMMIADDMLDFDGSDQHKKNGEAALEQATMLTPHIDKLAKRIKAVERVQKALKQELKARQRIEAWVAEEE
jgi:hypothetical protein